MPERIPLVSGPVFTRASSRNVFDLTSSFGATIGAAYDEAMTHNPVPAINRMIKLERLASTTEGVTGVDTDFLRPNLRNTRRGNAKANQDRRRSEFLTRMESNDQWLSPDRAKIVVESEGFTLDQIGVSKIGVNVQVLHEILKRHRSERKRQMILQRGSEGRFIPILAAGLAASVMDPLNIGSAFIPFAGVAKYSQALRAAGTSKISRAMVRAKFGAVDGFAGALVVEPLPLLAASQDHLDYDIDDTLMNLAFGTVLGGGMHMGVGYVGDAITLKTGGKLDVEPQGATGAALSRLPPEQIEANMKSALEAAALNRNLVVDELMEGITGPLTPGRIFDLPEGLTARVTDTGEVGVFARDGSIQSLDDLVDLEGLSPQARQVIESADSIQDAANKLLALSDREAAIDVRNVRDLQKILTKDEAVPLSTFLEREGGLAADKLIDEFNVDPGTRPKLFKEDGLTVREAHKLAKKAGFIDNQVGIKEFLRRLKSDLAGNRIFTPEAEAKLAPFREQAELLREFETTGRALQDIEPSGRFDLVGFSERFESDQNLRSFDADRVAEQNAILERTGDDVDTAELSKQVDDIEQLINQIEESTGVPDATFRSEIATITGKLEDSNRALDFASNCLLHLTGGLAGG